MMACASTVAVVVPSPAMSLVLVATDLTSWAPRVLERVFQVDLAGDGDAVVGDGRAAKGLGQHHMPAARAQRHADGVGELVHAGFHRAPRGLVELNLLAHRSFLFRSE